MNKIVTHPVVQEKLTQLRNKNTNPELFKKLVDEMLPFVLYEATKDLQLENVKIETPLSETVGQRLKNNVVLVPILRAGLGMVESAARIFPKAKIGHIGMYRNETTFQPVQYYFKFPAIDSNTLVLILDPMLATGNSAICSIDIVSKLNPGKIKFIGLIASAQGIGKLNQKCPSVDVYVAAVDQHLNSTNYIVPGLGDAGDRLFGTT